MPAECNCGCGEQVQTLTARFRPGHDEMVRSAAMYLLGDTMDLCRIFGFGPGGRNAQQLCAQARADKAS